MDLIQRAQQGFSMFLVGIEFLIEPILEVVVLARNRDNDLVQIYERPHSFFQPRKTVIFKVESDENKVLQNLTSISLIIFTK